MYAVRVRYAVHVRYRKSTRSWSPDYLVSLDAERRGDMLLTKTSVPKYCGGNFWRLVKEPSLKPRSLYCIQIYTIALFDS
jgi:hypothetical protein